MSRQQPEKARVGQLASAVALVLSAAIGSRAQAQPPAAAPQPSATEQRQQALEEITVTGSRIKRDDFSSAQPTTVINSEYLNNLGIINLGQAMVGIPQNVNRNSPDANAGGNFFNGSTLANLRGLNPFFGTRTLTLVDSRRHVPTNQGDGVDLNFIPTILIDRVETVTGGASASYGSGAIGGVQNILLDRDLEGIKVDVDFGATSEGDGESTHYGFAFGTKIGEKGNFVVGVEGEDSDGIFKCSSARDWCGTNTGTITNWLWPNDGRPQNVITPGLHETWNSRTGIFWLPNLSGRASNAGTVVPGVNVNSTGNGLVNFDPGVGGDGFFQTIAVGGEGEGQHEDDVLRSPVERTTGYVSFTRDITDNLGFFIEASGGSAESATEGGFTAVNYTCIRADNAYIQPSITGNANLLNFVTANSGAFPCLGGGVPFNKNWENQIDHGNDTDTDLQRYAFGFNGKFGESTWTWDAYYQYGKSEREQKVRDLVHANSYNYAIDTVLDAQGQPACRSVVNPAVTTPVAVANVTNALGLAVADPSLRIGCQPLNPFGANGLTAAAKSYAFGFIREDTTVKQDMAEFVASGDLGGGIGNAGPLRAAAGVSFRSEALDNIAAEEVPPAIRKDYAIQYGESFAGDVDVIEYFGELDVPFHEKFRMNVAARRSDYENTAGFGTPDPGAKYKYDIDTWKISAQWDIVPAVRLRLSQSHDIRAPNHRELYYGQVFTPGSFFGFIQPPFSSNPWTNSATPDPTASTLFGGARNNVKPEESDTSTIGLVIQPQRSNIRVALDYFDIELKNSISPANLSITIQGCYAGDPLYCSKITSGVTTPWKDPSVDHFGQPTGGQNSIPCPATCFIDINDYYSETFNAGNYNVKGLDVSFDWLKELDDGTFSVRVLGTRTFHQDVNLIRTPFAQLPPTDIAGTVGNVTDFLSDYAAAPDFAGNIIATWARGKFTVTGQFRFLDDGIVARNRIGPDDPAYNPRDPNFAATHGGSQTVSFNSIDSYDVTSLSGTYMFGLAGGNELQVWGSINNLFDEDPPLFGSMITGTNAVFYDTAGQTYRVGIRLSF
jgi:outer membrane receptor protein involved in Fe transport